MQTPTTKALNKITSGYPNDQCNSGILAKFIPYQPAIKESGKKTVVTTVSTFII